MGGFRGWLQKMSYKFYIFMQGRYGSDQLNRFLSGLLFFTVILSLFARRLAPAFLFINLLIIVLVYFRTFSKNLYKRSQENQKFLQATYKFRVFLNGLKGKWNTFKRDCEIRKTHHLYRCPKCKQKIKIPKGKGKIEVRCPKCSERFIKVS